VQTGKLFPWFPQLELSELSSLGRIWCMGHFG